MADYYGNADFSCHSCRGSCLHCNQVSSKKAPETGENKCDLGLLFFVKYYFNKLIIFYTIK